MLRGELWEVDLASPPGGSGREQSGRRPAVVLQGGYDPNNPMCSVAPITSNLSAARFPHTITVSPTQANGLSIDSVVMVFQLRALDTRRFVRRLGHLSVSEIATIDGILPALLGLG